MCERNFSDRTKPALSLHGGNEPVGALRPILNSKIRCEIGQTPRTVRDILGGMIMGAHFLLYSKDPEADRAFFRDILGLRYVDVGGGWMIFAMSPAEAAIHPLEGETSQGSASHELLGAELYLMCDDLEGLIKSLKAKNVHCTEVERPRWGIKTMIPLPSGGAIGLYQPAHPTALNLNSK